MYKRQLGHRLTNNSLTTSKSTRDTDSTTLHTGEQSVQDTLTDNERRVRAKLLSCRSWHTDGPVVHHAVIVLLAIELNLEDLLINSIASLLCNPRDRTACPRRKQNLMVAEQGVFVDATEKVTTGDVVTHFLVGALEVPFSCAVEGRHINTAGNVDGLGLVENGLEWSLDTVVDCLHQTWT